MYVVCSCLYPDMYRHAHEGPLSSSIALRSLTEPETHYESLAIWSEDSQGLLLSAHGTGVIGVYSQDQVCNVGSVDLNFPEQYLIAPREERNGKSFGEH